LVKIKQYREKGRLIVYIDVTWVDSNLTFRKCWQSNDVIGVQKNVNSANTLIILHAGTSKGFIPDAKLVYKAGCATGDYHGQTNGHNFQEWLTEKLLPHIPPQSVVILDNALYHSIQIDKPPTPYSLKKDMLSWLRNRGVECNEGLRKNDLYNQIFSLNPKEKVFKIDCILWSVCCRICVI
jgi:hypothetical protein